MKRLILSGLVVVITIFAASVPVVNQSSEEPLVSTFSMVAFDPETGDLGVVVQSKFPNLRPVVPWAKAGVGAVATQSFAELDYGIKGLELMENGATAEEALRIGEQGWFGTMTGPSEAQTIDEVAIFDRALNAEEIRQLAR